MLAASVAQTESHAVVQQNGSAPQTLLQQSLSLQPGALLATQQSWGLSGPQTALKLQRSLQKLNASPAQMPSHAVEQQKGSAAHTVLQQVKSLQPAEPSGEAEQQSLAELLQAS